MPVAREDPLRKSYHAAISLNNAGVYLLEKGYVLQAHRTFSDAVNALKGVVYFDRTDDGDVVDDMLEYATGRLVSCSKQDSAASTLNVTTLFCDPSMPPSANFLTSVLNPGMLGWTPIHIDMIEPLSSLASPNIELSILLFNVGITSFLLSQTKNQETDHIRHLRNAVQFFEFSTHLSLSNGECQGDSITIVDKVCALGVAFHAVRCLIQVLPLVADTSGDKMDCHKNMYNEIRTRMVQMQVGSPIYAMISRGVFAAAA